MNSESQPINIAPKYIPPKSEGFRERLPSLYGIDFFRPGSPFSAPMQADRIILAETIKARQQENPQARLVDILAESMDARIKVTDRIQTPPAPDLTTPMLVALAATDLLAADWTVVDINSALQTSISRDEEILKQRRELAEAQQNPEVVEKTRSTKKTDYREGLPRFDIIQKQTAHLKEFEAAVKAVATLYSEEPASL